MFRPTDDQAYVKAKLHARLELASHLDPETLPIETIVRLVGTTQVAEWDKNVEFAVWLRDKDDSAPKIRSYAHSAVDTLKEILEDTGARDTARVKAAELLVKLADLFPAVRKEVKYLDKEVAELSPTELRRQIRQAEQRLLLKGGFDDET